ncbi:hypothetical protein BC829DRAFT_277257 [Chytridium lagenaria]|nr:hypothetical protein BC829DRAFT_277257 [Chytridium lagenaria]
MVSTIIIAPQNGGRIKNNQPLTVTIKNRNLATGFFDDPQNKYYQTPQTLNSQGIIEGHQHITIENIGNGQNPPDAQRFSFFKGLNAAEENGVLTNTFAVTPETLPPETTVSAPSPVPLVTSLSSCPLLNVDPRMTVSVSRWRTKLISFTHFFFLFMLQMNACRLLFVFLEIHLHFPLFFPYTFRFFFWPFFFLATMFSFQPQRTRKASPATILFLFGSILSSPGDHTCLLSTAHPTQYMSPLHLLLFFFHQHLHRLTPPALACLPLV